VQKERRVYDVLSSKGKISASAYHHLDRVDMRMAVIGKIARTDAEEQLGLKRRIAVQDEATYDPSLCRVHRDPVVRGMTEI
jgi:hypothetical protein